MRAGSVRSAVVQRADHFLQDSGIRREAIEINKASYAAHKGLSVGKSDELVTELATGDQEGDALMSWLSSRQS
jgi:hypothetical protein